LSETDRHNLLKNYRFEENRARSQLYNPVEMINRQNYPNPYKVQNMNYLEVTSLKMFDKMFEELTSKQKREVI
jgi:hypothetical protein